MMLKILKEYWQIFAIIIMIVIVCIQCNSINQIKKENSRLSSNYYAMCDSTLVYKTRSGKLASKNENLQLTIKELDALYGNAIDKLEDLKIKKKNLDTYQNGVIEKEIHDTITLHDTIIENVINKTGVYSDGCTDLTFSINNEYASFDLISKDDIDIFISIEKDGKWYQFWKWPRKRNYVTTATSACPYTTVSIRSCKIVK